MTGGSPQRQQKSEKDVTFLVVDDHPVFRQGLVAPAAARMPEPMAQVKDRVYNEA